MKSRRIGAALIAAVIVAAGVTTTARTQDAVGSVYSASNSAAGNEVLMFGRGANGALTLAQAFSTGGLGSGDALGNQGGIVMTSDGKFMLVVNAGSNDISVLETTGDGLTLRDRTPSGGLRPISVTVQGRLVYVLNAGGGVGGADSVVGFRLSRGGALTMIAGSQRALSATSTGPAEVALSPDGESLIVTEKATNRVDVFPVDETGALGALTSYASSGVTPFGFAFGKRDQFFVSEAFGGAANASAISSYQLTSSATFGVVSPSVPTTETAACWVVVSPDGRFLYTTNTGSGTVSGFSIKPDGTIALLDANGVTATTGGGVTDVTMSENGRYLYALRPGAGAIAAFRIEEHGALKPLGSVSLPAGANGIVAR
ncbi:MAG: beta-propeller fold lactonase family protein [Vicinamibacterales bacterium]